MRLTNGHNECSGKEPLSAGDIEAGGIADPELDRDAICVAVRAISSTSGTLSTTSVIEPGI
jgi:hypothetical protein